MREKAADKITWGQALCEAVQLLSDAGIEEAQTDAQLLMEAVSGMDRTHALMSRRDEAPGGLLAAYRETIGKRARRIPLQHITGKADFYGLTFRVSEDVLIPRPDTELLLERALEKMKGISCPQVLDLCTGSGCIGITLALNHPTCRVTASDISADALAVAGENARRLGADVIFVQSDLFAAIEGCFDIIVSNPPYIPTGDIPFLEKEVRDHDPMLALDGGADGLEVYRRLIADAGNHLKPDGWLLVEIGQEEGQDVRSLFENNGYCEIMVRQDMSGRDRQVEGKYHV